jgi:hypothetical protein
MTSQEWQQQIQLYILERRTLLVSVVSGLIALLIWPLGIWPLWNQYSSAQTQIRRLQNQVNQVSSRATLLQGVDAERREDFRRAEAALPLQKQPFAALLGLNEIASRSGVSLTSYDLNPGVVSTDSAQSESQRPTANGIFTFPLEVTFQGSFAQLQDAFRLIETTLPLFEIDEYSISPQANATDSADLVRSELTIRMVSAPLQAGEFARSTASQLSPKQQAVIEKLRTYTLTEPQNFLPQEGVEFNNPDYLLQ